MMGAGLLTAVVFTLLGVFWAMLRWTFRLIDYRHEKMREEDELLPR